MNSNLFQNELSEFSKAYTYTTVFLIPYRSHCWILKSFYKNFYLSLTVSKNISYNTLHGPPCTLVQ